MTRSYTFYGETERNYEAWEKWMADAFEIGERLGCPFNYYDFMLVNDFYGKIHPIGGIKRRFANIKKKGGQIEALTLQALPENFKCAGADYIMSLLRWENNLTLILNQDYKIAIDEQEIIPLLRRNISATGGEVYEMGCSESPELYVAGVNPRDYYKSLKMIKTLE